MHELGITQGILDIVREKAQEVGASRVTTINLVIGMMSGIVDDSVQFYFDILSQDSLAQGATLSFSRIPMQVKCRRCDCSFSPEEMVWTCPQCGEWEVEITAGREFYIDSIEVE